MSRSYKNKIKRQREHDIVLAAANLIAQKGYANFSMDELADEVGVSKPTLYQHFNSKEDLGLKVLLETLGNVDKIFQAPLEGRAIERLEETLRRLLHNRYVIFDSTFSNAGIEQLFIQLRNHPALLKRRDEVIRHMSSLVEQAQKEGDIVQNISIMFIVRSFFAIMTILSKHHWASEQEIAPPDISQAIEDVLRLALYGIRPHTP